ncbi:MAG: phosphoribosyl-AMP cyclohydrolase [Pseudomonadota bacterium]
MSVTPSFQPPSQDKHELEAGTSFSPRFDDNGLITAVVIEDGSRALLMVAYMNALALEKTLTTGKAHYWSRSRKKLWLKGEESGNFQEVVEVRTDCDQDVLEVRVRQLGNGVACHTGRHSCFYRVVKSEDDHWHLAYDEELEPKLAP